MAGPWEKYGAAPAAGPWAKYAAPGGTAAAVQQSVAEAIAPASAGARRLEFDDAGNPRVEYGDAPPRRPPDDRGVLEQVLDGGRLALQGIGSGAATLAGLPAEAVNRLPWIMRNASPVDMIAEKVGLPKPTQAIADAIGLPEDKFSDTPLLGVEMNKATGRLPYEAAGGEVIEPRNVTERYVERIGQEIGAQAIPLAGMAAAGMRLGVQGARQLGPVGRFFVEPFAVNPGKAAAKELAAGVATGAGAQTGREMWGQDSAGADLVGGLLGGATYSVGGSVLPPVGDAIAAMTGARWLSSDVVNNAVVDEMARASDTLGDQVATGKPVDTSPLVAKLQRPPEVERLVPGYTASTAEAAEDYGLSMLESSARAGAPQAGAIAKRDRANAAAVDARVNSLAPTEQPGAFSAGLEGYRAQRIGAAEGDLAQAQQAFETAVAKIQPNMTGETRGAAVREGLDNALRAAKEVEDIAWRDVAGTTDPAPLAGAFDEVTRSLTKAERGEIGNLGAIDIPNQLLGDDVTNAVAPQPVDLREVTSLRSVLTDAAREADLAGKPKRARIIGQYVSAVENYLDTAVPDELRAVYDQARAVSRDVNERFNRDGDPLAAVVDRREGRPVVPDSGVARNFTRPDEGQASNINRLFAETDLSSRAVPVREAIRDQILAEAKDGSGGYMKPQSIEDYITGREQVFDRMPDTRADLQQGATARRDVMAAERGLKDVEAEVGPKGTGPVAKYLRFGDEKASNAMEGVFSSDRPAETMDKLLNAVGNDPRAVQGARQAFWGKMAEKGRGVGLGGVEQWLPPQWVGFLTDTKRRPAVERLYRDDPEILAQVDELANVLKNAGLERRTVRGNNPSGTALMQRGLNGPTFAEWQAKFYEMQRSNGPSPLYVVTYMLGKVARGAVRGKSEQAFQRILNDATMNREVGALLLEKYNPADRAAMARKLRTWYGDRAGTLIELLDEDDEQSDPVVDAVMGVP